MIFDLVALVCLAVTSLHEHGGCALAQEHACGSFFGICRICLRCSSKSKEFRQVGCQDHAKRHDFFHENLPDCAACLVARLAAREHRVDDDGDAAFLALAQFRQQCAPQRGIVDEA